MSVRHTKIVATLGPSSSDSAVIRELIVAGVNVFRLNFSHGSHDSHQRLIEIIREQSELLGEPVAILQDLCGPKIRVSALPKNESMTLVRGQEVEIVEVHDGEVAERQIGVSLEGIANDLRADEPVLLDDGHFELVVVSCDPAKRSVRCRVVHGGLLKMKKGVNFPKSSLSVPSVTEKDLADLKFGMEQDLDFVALSFVRHEDEIKALRKRIQEAGKKIRIIAKIEKGEAIERIKQVIEASDGIMVARGDLGVEMPVTRVPAIQKDLIAEAVRQDRFVITATQMLESMTSSPRPTRAEVSDVANAIYDGTDAVMLSGETASGQYPVESVRMMAEIAVEADAVIRSGRHEAKLQSDLDRTTFADALCHAAFTLYRDTNARRVITYTGSWRTALFMSRYRPCPDIIGATTNRRVYRQMAILRGVHPIFIPETETVRELTVATEKSIVDRGLGRPGEVVIHVGGSNLAARSNSNSIRIRRLFEDIELDAQSMR